MVDKLKVLFLSPEVVPFAKTGGLADVAGPGSITPGLISQTDPEPVYRAGPGAASIIPSL